MSISFVRRYALLASASFVTIGATAALAQTAGSDGGGSTSSSQTTADNANDMGLRDIIVTAEKRATSNQRTAVSIGVVSGDDLRQQGAHTAAQVFKDVAGIEGSTGGTNGELFTIRGVGGGGLFGQDASVTTSVNGVFNQRGNSIRGNYYDVARVEVVRGPQSTLTGRSAEGGAINIVSNEPKLGVYEGEATAEAGNYALLAGEATVNLPVGDKVALRAAVNGVKHDGYFTDGTSDDDTFSGRLRLLVQPTERLKLVVTGEMTTIGGKPENGNQTGVISLGGAPYYTLPRGAYGTISPTSDTARYKVYNLYADLTWNLDWATLYFQPTVQRNSNVFAFYNTNPATYATLLAAGNSQTAAYNAASSVNKGHSPQRQHTFELRLSSPTGSKLEWLVGGFYYWNQQLVANAMANGSLTGFPYVADPQLFPELTRRTETNKDLYAQATYPVTESTRITAGGRYSQVSKDRGYSPANFVEPDGSIINTNLFVRLNDNIANSTIGKQVFYNLPAASVNFKDFNWKVSVQQQLAARSMVYAMVSTGWKAGGFLSSLPAANDVCTGCTTPGPFLAGGFNAFFQPEHLTAFEVGTKNTLLDNKLRLNASAYYYNYRGYQFNYTVNPYNLATGIDPDLTTTITSNAKKAINYGAELESVYLVTSDDRLNATVSYTNAKLKEVVVADNSSAAVKAWAAALHNVALPGAPKWQIKGGYTHNFHLSDGMILSPHVDASYTGRKTISSIPGADTQTTTGNYPTYYLTRTDIYQQGPATKINADLTLASADGKWSLNGYVRNLTKKVTYHSVQFPQTFFTSTGAFATGSISYFPDDPRTFGIVLNAKF